MANVLSTNVKNYIHQSSAAAYKNHVAAVRSGVAITNDILRKSFVNHANEPGPAAARGIDVILSAASNAGGSQAGSATK